MCYQDLVERRSEAEQLLRILEENFPLDRLRRRELPHLRDLTGARAERRLAGLVVAVAAVEQLVLMPGEERARGRDRA